MISALVVAFACAQSDEMVAYTTPDLYLALEVPISWTRMGTLDEAMYWRLSPDQDGGAHAFLNVEFRYSMGLLEGYVAKEVAGLKAQGYAVTGRKDGPPADKPLSTRLDLSRKDGDTQCWAILYVFTKGATGYWAVRYDHFSVSMPEAAKDKDRILNSLRFAEPSFRRATRSRSAPRRPQPCMGRNSTRRRPASTLAPSPARMETPICSTPEAPATTP